MLRSSVVLAALACLAGTADAFGLTGPAPILRAGVSRAIQTRDSAVTISMGRKGAQTGKSAGREKTKRVRTAGKGIGAIIKTKAITGVTVSKAMILKKLDAADKANFEAELLNDKVKTFMMEEAGSSMYPKLMKMIKSKASALGVSVPDRWAYEAKANSYQRTKLQAKIAEAEEAAAAPAEEGEEGAAEEAAPAEEAAAAE